MTDPVYKLFSERSAREAVSYSHRVCKTCMLGGVSYVAIFSVLGMVIHLIDMWKLVQGKSILTEDLWRNRVQRGNRRVVSVETEKKLKLAFSILYFEHYLFMFIAFLNNEPILLIPWLIMESAVLVLEFILLIVRVLVETTLPSKQELAMLFFIIYSFLQVYCYQQSITPPSKSCSY